MYECMYLLPLKNVYCHFKMKITENYIILDMKNCYLLMC